MSSPIGVARAASYSNLTQPPQASQSVTSPDDDSGSITTDQPERHRYSFPSMSTLPLPRSTESVLSFNRDGVSETSLPVKNSKSEDRPVHLKKLIVLPDGGDDFNGYTSDTGNYFTTRPNVMAAIRRGLDSAEVRASSPVNSTGVHIVIDDGKDHNDITYSDDVIVVVDDVERTSGTDRRIKY